MHIFITGGAGFIGTNLADSFLAQGHKIKIFDNFSRRGSELNVTALASKYTQGLRVIRGDIRMDIKKMEEEMGGADAIFHLAGQVAVTTSFRDPRYDFETNALGTLNVLEAVRRASPSAIFIVASTNKVYGALADVPIANSPTRYHFQNRPHGINESQPLDFHSPYGCSKGTADQYVHDYARMFGMPTVILRMSCIAGPHQFGIEDQGWVAHFVIRALFDQPVTIFGDGKQVRDILHVEDLSHLFTLLVTKGEELRGEIFNVGGGSEFSLSVLECLDLIEAKLGRKIERRFADWRAGDQKVYISDIGKVRERLGWTPTIPPEKTIEDIIAWTKGERETIERVLFRGT